MVDANQMNVANGKSIIEILTAILRKFSRKQQQSEILKQLIEVYFVNFNAIGSTTILNEQIDSMISDW